jgi:hypothetical protein
VPVLPPGRADRPRCPGLAPAGAGGRPRLELVADITAVAQSTEDLTGPRVHPALTRRATMPPCALLQGGTVEIDIAVQAETWRETVAFLGSHLGRRDS